MDPMIYITCVTFTVQHHHHHLSLNRKDRWGTTDDFTTSSPHLSMFSTAFWDLANSRPVHSLMLSSHLFSLSALPFPPFTVPCKMVLAKRETWPYHCSLRLFTMIRRSSCSSIACWILAQTSSFVTWSCMRCVVSCGSNSFPWFVFFFWALLWGSMIHKHTEIWMRHVSASVVSETERNTLVIPNLVDASVVCATLESISGLEPSSVITEPRYLKLLRLSQASVHWL